MVKYILIALALLSVSPSYSSTLDDEIECMALNMYWESRNQSFKGLLAVGNVVMNRMADSRFPNTACDVIHQAVMIKSWRTQEFFPKRNQCHFSWYCDGKSDEIPKQDEKIYQLIKGMAMKVYTGWFDDITDGATHYHAYYVRPDWAQTKTPTVRVDAHIFYRWER